jgi:hypothetical protein
MPHQREAIRDAMVTALTGLATTGARVYRSRVYPIAAHLLPALLVYARGETSEREIVMGVPTKLVRRCDIIVEGMARAVADVDETLDDIAAEVEAAIGGSQLSSAARDCTLTSTDIDIVDGGDQPLGVVRLTFAVTYRTVENNPTTAS